MVGRCDGIVRNGNFAIRADQHGFPRRTRAVGFRDAICNRHRTVFVAQQVVGKREFIAECTVIKRAVIADADDGCISVFKVLDSITEPVAFDRSAGCVGFGIPPEQNITPGKVIFLDRGAVLVREAEIWRVNAGGNQCHSGFSIGYSSRPKSITCVANPVPNKKIPVTGTGIVLIVRSVTRRNRVRCVCGTEGTSGYAILRSQTFRCRTCICGPWEGRGRRGAP